MKVLIRPPNKRYDMFSYKIGKNWGKTGKYEKLRAKKFLLLEYNNIENKNSGKSEKSEKSKNFKSPEI